MIVIETLWSSELKCYWLLSQSLPIPDLRNEPKENDVDFMAVGKTNEPLGSEYLLKVSNLI